MIERNPAQRQRDAMQQERIALEASLTAAKEGYDRRSTELAQTEAAIRQLARERKTKTES